MKQSLRSQLSFLRHAFKTFQNMSHIHRMIEDNRISSGSECQHLLKVAAKHASKHDLAVIADKDSKRRVFMAHSGYNYTLFKVFMADPDYYHVCKDLSLEEVACVRNRAAHTHLPARLARREAFDVDNIQYGYHTYKTQCLSPIDGLMSQRSHAHQRELVSDVRNPYRSYFLLISRNVRLVKYLASEPCWTV